MAFSVNTNAGALTALQNLGKSSKALQLSQSRINTGLKVSSAKDNAAVFNIAQGLKADKAGLSAVSTSLDRAKSVLDVTIAAAETISDIMIEIRSLSVAASDTGMDQESRDALFQDFLNYSQTIDSTAELAEFSGTKLLTNDASQTSAIIDADGNNTITVTGQDMTMDYFQYGLPNANFNNATNSAFMVTLADNALDKIEEGLSQFGAKSKRIDQLIKFNDKLNDSIEVGIGNLVDADLARESAQLQSNQVKQQLGLQALGIANQAPQAVLSLF